MAQIWVAQDLGFEPKQTVLETVMLPITSVLHMERYGVIETPSSVWKTEVLTVKLIAQIAPRPKGTSCALDLFFTGNRSTVMG